mgnify:CR=1 FL=1
MENASCEFDVQTLRPTYRLLIGVPGRSNAFAIAGRLGLEGPVIEHAQSLISKENTRFEEVVSQLEQARQELEKEREQTRINHDESEMLRRKADERLRALNAEKEKELEKAQEALEEQKDKYLRLSAEFDNYRKRTLKEKAELILNGGEKSLGSILPVVDDFERAIKTMETATDVNAVKEGVELIYNKFMAVLAQNGVKVIETKDQPLDTDFHEAIAVIPAPSEAQKGKILDCVQTGYTLNDKVLRHAKVVVGE